MNYYQELRLLPDEGANLGFLWQKVFQQLHIALVEHGVKTSSVDKNNELENSSQGNKSQKSNRRSEIGISIPGYTAGGAPEQGFPLGDKIRLFANSQQVIEELNLSKWLLRYEDYVQIKTIKPVPKDVEHVCFTRKHVRTQKQIQLKARQMAQFKAKQTGEPIEKWFAHFSEAAPELNETLPFVHAVSLSGAQISRKVFPLFIQMRKCDKASIADFTCYGLSYSQAAERATVPWF